MQCVSKVKKKHDEDAQNMATKTTTQKKLKRSCSLSTTKKPQVRMVFHLKFWKTCYHLVIRNICYSFINLQFIIWNWFIDVLKNVKAVPIFKNPFKAGNYRPISLLSNVDKIFEKLIHKPMMEYLDQNNVPYDKQFGFQTKHQNTKHTLAIFWNLNTLIL